MNKDYAEEEPTHKNFSRKLKADLFIDDRNIGGLPDWGTIYRMVTEKKSYEDILREEFLETVHDSYKPKKKWWQIG